jgi:C4-type Zn-finger protein
MPLNFDIYINCPTCGGTIRRAIIDLHPTQPDAAIRSLKCGECGYEKTTVLSLRPVVPPPPELTA